MSVCVSMVWNGGLHVIPNVWMSEDNYMDLALLLSLCESQGVSVCWSTCCTSWLPVLCSKCLNTLSHFHDHNSIIFISKDMPILSVIFMNWISFLFHVTIPTGGRNLISTNVVPSLTIQPPTTPTLYKSSYLWHCICTPGTYVGLQHTTLQHGMAMLSQQPFFYLVFTKIAMVPSPQHPLNNSHFKGKHQFSCALLNYPRFSLCWTKKLINALSNCLWHFTTLHPVFF